MNQEQQTFRKAVLRIDCREKKAGDTAAVAAEKSVRQRQNQAAKRALEQGNANAGAMTGSSDLNGITVQYNPASIKYRAGAEEGGNVKYENQGNNSCQITTVSGESTVNMSFTLVFHSRYSGDLLVREQMERILDMIRKSATKQVEFSWANIQIEGRLVSFSGEYDMFDVSGMPISGHMDMTIETSKKPERTSATLSTLKENR